jgi:AraC family transcriptional regulator
VNYTEVLAEASRFIEGRLGEEVTLEAAADAAGLSPYHFHRIFKAVVGESFAVFVRRRKLHEAAERLVRSTRSILEIALDYGFESHEGFSRAFQRTYGESPSAFRRRGTISYVNRRPPADRMTLAHLGGMAHEPAIVDKPGGSVVGLEIAGRIDERDILRLWDGLKKDMPGPEYGADTSEAFGICDYTLRYDLRRAACGESYTYFAGFRRREEAQAGGRFAYRLLRDQRYAIFEHAAPLELVERTYQYIYGTWLFHSGMELAKAPEIQYFSTEFLLHPENPRIEIWVPIV